jgi:hypothetical protein
MRNGLSTTKDFSAAARVSPDGEALSRFCDEGLFYLAHFITSA